MEKLKAEGSKYKLDNAERAIEAGLGEPSSASWYATGEPGKNWEDLCRGPHVPSTGRIGVQGHVLASSYWHGDENSDRLTRVYGTAFFRQKQDLDEHLEQLEEAKKRDHRVLGQAARAVPHRRDRSARG
jgi:threonyl-tRNA synthetase